MFHGWPIEKSQCLKLLKQLLGLYENKDKWIYWPIAVDDNGIEVKPNNPKAVKYSLIGACELFTAEYKEPENEFIDCATREFLNDLSNDNLIHGKCDYDEEMDLIKMAIKELEKEND